MAVKRKGKRRGARRSRPVRDAAPAPARDDLSSVASVIPDGADAGPVGDGESDGAAAPPLPPDEEIGSGDDAGARGDRSGPIRDAAAREDREREQRVMVLQGLFSASFATIPERILGGPLADAEALALAQAWEIPLRPYWDAIMGPWMGAFLTTAAVIGPRVVLVRMAEQQRQGAGQ